MAAQSLVSVRFEKTETPARFEPMPSKKHADRMLHVTFGTHKKQSFGSETPERQQQSSLCQAKNRSKRTYNHKQERGFRTMAAQSLVSVRFEKAETPARFEPMPSKKHADRMLHVTFGTHKKQSFGSETPERQQQSNLCQAKNRSKRTYNHKQERGFRTMAAQSLVSVRFEKTETPARFEPMPSKKHADRMLHVTFGTHKKQSFGSEIQPNASSSRTSAKQKTVRNAHITTSRNVDSERWLLKVSSASDSKRPKHQQDSSPCQAKNTQTECFTSPYKEPIKNKASVPKHPNASSSRASAKQKTVRNAHITTSRNVDSERWLLKVSSASDSKRPKHQQDSSPCQAKNTQTECFTSPLEPIKNKASVPKHPNASSSRASAKQKTRRKNASRDLWPKQPNASMSRAHAKQKNTPKECLTWPFEPIKNNALVRFHNTRTPARLEPIKNNALVRFHNTQTPARFEPMPSKKHADRMLHVTFGTFHKDILKK